MNIIDCSFLEVTINSNKLMNILEKLTKQTNQNTSQIRNLRDVIPTIKQSVCTSLQATEARVKLQTQRSAMKTRQQMIAMTAKLDDLQQELHKNMIINQKKFKEKQVEIQKLQEQKKRIQNIINTYEEDRLVNQNKILDQIQSIKQSVTFIEKQINQSDSKTDQKFQIMYLKIQSLVRKNSASRMRDSSVESKGRASRNSSIFIANKSNLAPANLANWAKFSNKINQIEKNCQQKFQNSTAINKVVYSRKINQGENFQDIEENESEKSETQNREQQQLTLDDFSQLFNCLNQQNQKAIESLKNKMIIQQQKSGINSRKIQKITQIQNQFRMILRRLQEKRSEDHNYESMRNQIKKIQYEVTEDLEKKLNKDIYEKQKKKIFDKLYIIQENLTEKAEKGDMKKAFLFMEEKIKQLIVLIASDQGDEKDGAIRKVPVKCLSCDKGLDTQNTPPNTMPPAQTGRDDVTTRAVTRKIRTRIHTSNQNLQINS